MITELTIECIGGCYWEEECIKVIEFDMNETLGSLHHFILESVNFDCDHLSQFFVGKTPRPYSRSNIATYQEDTDDFFDDEYDDEDSNTGSYEKTLTEIYPLPPKYKLYYNFDFGDNWMFSIKKGRKKPYNPVPGVKYPRIIKEIGDNPEQYPGCEE